MKKTFWKRLRRNDRLYHRNLLLLIGSVTAVLIAAAALLYANFEQISQRIVFSNAMESLEQTRRDASVLVETGQNLAQQVYADKSCQSLLHYSHPSGGDTGVGLNQLGNYQFMKFIDSIYIYNARSGCVYLSKAENRYHNYIVPVDEFFDSDVLEWVNDYDKYPAYTAIPRKVKLSDGQETSFYSFFGYNHLDKDPDGRLMCAVVVNIRSDWIGGVMLPSKADPELLGGETFLLDAGGRVISDSQHYPMFQDLSSDPSFQKILSSEQDGYLVTGSGTEQQFIAYTAPDNMNWRYVRAMPYHLIVKDIDSMRERTILLVLLVALGAVLTFYVVNRVLYRPIERYQKDIETLNEEHRATFYGAKQAFLRQLLTERQTGSQRKALAQQFEAYELGFSPEGEFFVALIKIDGYREFHEKWGPEERSALRFGILNMAGDMFAPEFVCEGADMGWGNLVVLFHFRTPGVPAREEFSGKVRQFQKTVQKYLELSVSLFLSELGGVEELSQLYSQALEAGRRRLFAGSGCLLYYSEGSGRPAEEWSYPEKKEHALTEALLKGNLDQAQVLYLEIIDECKKYASAQFGPAVFRLMLSLNQLMATLRKRWPNADLPGKPLSLDLESAESMDEIHQEFFSFMRQIVQYSGKEKKKSRGELLADSVDKIISIQYADPSLCIESIADTLELSASYLGRIYKQSTGSSITERIQTARMERARQLLAETADPISYIAQEVGYGSDTYFYKIFKHENGVTPLDYRKSRLSP